MNGPRRVYVIVGVILVAILMIWIFAGCALTKGRIRGAGVTVQAQKDGNGASLASDSSAQVLTLPAGTKVTTVKTEAVRAIPATETTPAVAPQPATEKTEFVLAKETQWRKDETKIAADTGVIDTTVAVKRLQVAENRYLLFAAIGAAVAGGFFLYIKYPTPALMCGAASVVYFLAWRLSDLPDYFWMIGAAAVAGGAFLYLGHRRGEHDGVKAALAGDIEPKVTPVVK